MATQKTSIAQTWQRKDSTTYLHAPSGMYVIKMKDDTWSVCTGCVENIAIGLAHWVSHKHNLLRDAKSQASMHHRRTQRA